MTTQDKPLQDQPTPDRLTLRALLAKPVDVIVGGHAVPVTPMSWWVASDALQALAPLLPKLPPQLFGQADGSSDELGSALLGVVMAGREEIAEFLMVAANLDFEDVAALAPVHLVELVLGVVEVNADFFALSLPGLLTTVGSRLDALKAKLQPPLRQLQTASATPTTSSV